MKTDANDTLRAHDMNLLTRYLTPFALIIIFASLVTSLPDKSIVMTILTLALFSVLFNIGSAHLARKYPEKSAALASIRIPANFTVNVAIMWVLGPQSSTIWLLFVLMPIGTAVYGGYGMTLVASLISAATVVAMYTMRGVATWDSIGATLVHASFIVLLSLFVRKLRSHA